MATQQSSETLTSTPTMRSLQELAPARRQLVDQPVPTTTTTSPQPPLVEVEFSPAPPTAEVVEIVVPITKVNQAKFWGWGAFTFLVTFFVVFGILAGVNPTLTQQVNALGQPTGARDYYKIVGGSVIAAIIVFLVYVLVVLGRPDRF